MLKNFIRKLIGYNFSDNPYNPHTWVTGTPDVGKRVWIGAFCLIDSFHDHLTIGNYCEISSGVEILTHSSMIRCVTERVHNGVDHAPTEIGEYCFIGTSAVILMGSKIGHHSVVAAGAVVPQFSVIPPYSIVAGVPAKVIGSSKRYLKGVEKEGISVVIPVYNEQGTIEKVVEEALSELKKLTKNYEVFLVNDGSTDKSKKILDRLAKRKNVRVFHHKKNMGFSGAIKSALYGAKKHFVFLAPGDGQFKFKELEKFVESIKGYDVAVGYRIKNSESLVRKINFKLFRFLNLIFFGIKLNDFSNVSMWRRPVLETLNVEATEHSATFLSELVYKSIQMRYKFAEVPIHWHRRKGDKAKGGNPKMIVRTLEEIIKLWYNTNLSNKN